MLFRGLRWLILPVFVVGCFTSCKEDLSNLVKKGQDTASKVKDGAGVGSPPPPPPPPDASGTSQPKAAGGRGMMELTLDKPVKIDGAHVSLIAVPGGRPTVLQIANCEDESDETYPSMLFHAEVSGGALSELTNEKVSGQLFVRTTENGPVYHSSRNQPVELTITTADENTVAGEIKGQVVNTETNKPVTVTGKFSESLQ